MSPLKSLPAAERDVLVSLHRKKQATARDLREDLARVRPMTHGSVLTLLKRLEAKGLVKKEKGAVGKAFVYEACPQPKTTFGSIVRQVVQRVFDGDSVALVASLFEAKAPTAEEVEKLQKLLDELRTKEGKK